MSLARGWAACPSGARRAKEEGTTAYPGNVVAWDPSMVFGALEMYDLPDLVKSIEPRTVRRVDRVNHPSGRR